MHCYVHFKSSSFRSINYFLKGTFVNRLIGLVGQVFANGSGDRGSISGCAVPKIFKMILDTSFLNAHQYKVRIKGKVEQSSERSNALP